MKVIIYLNRLDYYWMTQRPQHMMKEFSKAGYKVIYCTITDKYPDRQIEIEKKFYLCNSGSLGRLINKDDYVILWLCHPYISKEINKYKSDLVVFDAIDFMEGPVWKRNSDFIHKKADIIFASSKKIFIKLREVNDNTYLCPNAVDFEHFSKVYSSVLPVPKDITNKNRPIIGYIGALASWIDWSLLTYIAHCFKQCSIVMIGPKIEAALNLPKRQNIYYLGLKEYEVLPDYIQQFSVCIIPFKQNSITEACDPIKKYEYLATGKPIVSTPIPEVLDEKEILVADSKEDFVEKIEYCIKNDKKESQLKRMQIGVENSWEHRVEYAKSIIDKFTEKA